MRRYAEDTAVPIARSRSEIDKLLREWGADGIQWSDNFRSNQVVLRFLWETAGGKYLARFEVRLPSSEDLEPDAIDKRTRKVSQARLQKLLEERGKREHRVLLLWLRAALNAVQLGIVTAEALFLPFLEGRDGKTVAEFAIPRLAGLLSGGAERLLPAGDAR